MKKLFLKIPCQCMEEEDTTEYQPRRRYIEKKNVRRRWGNYQFKHLMNMVSSLSPHYRFARYLAESMDDLKSLPQYLKWTERFPQELLEEIRANVLSKKDIINKGAYFTVLLKHHQQSNRDNPRY